MPLKTKDHWWNMQRKTRTVSRCLNGAKRLYDQYMCTMRRAKTYRETMGRAHNVLRVQRNALKKRVLLEL